MGHGITLKDAYKGGTLDLDRTLPPDVTVSRFKEKLKTVNLDILKETIRIDNGRLDIPVYFSICGYDAEGVIGTKKQMGKGGTPAQAEASAVMELAERFSLFSFMDGRNNYFIGQHKDIMDSALPFHLIARSVHDDSTGLDAAREVFSRLPLKWASAYNMTRKEEVLIPVDWFFAINQFNGSSAGNCMEEAVLQGVCEVVERHASSIISRNKLNTPHINIGSISDRVALELIEKYRNAGIELHITDFSLDIGIPSVGVLAYDPATYPQESEIVWTAGTATNPQKALIRALTEAAQLAGDFNSASNYVASGLPKFKDLDQAEFILASSEEVDISSLPDLSNNNIRLEIESCIEILQGTGLEVIVVDVTHPELQVPACYVIIPGAHFRERAAGASVGMFSAKLIAERGDPEWAVRELERMEILLPGMYYTSFFLGISYISLGQPLKALNHFDNALSLSPEPQDLPSIFSYKGICLKDLGSYREAIKTLEEAEKYDSERPDIYNLMGFCYFKLKEHEKAIECFNRVLNLNPASAIDYANIASNYRDLGNQEKAIDYYRFALELDPSIDFARKNLQILEGSGHG